MPPVNKSRLPGCVVLAAGAGKRFGGGKLLSPFRGEALYRRALAAVPGDMLSAVAVVSGEEEILAAARERGFLAVGNDAPAEGISRSIRLGLDALGRAARPSSWWRTSRCCGGKPWRPSWPPAGSGRRASSPRCAPTGSWATPASSPPLFSRSCALWRGTGAAGG